MKIISGKHKKERSFFHFIINEKIPTFNEIEKTTEGIQDEN